MEVKGKLGTLVQEFSGVSIAVNEGSVWVTRPSDSIEHKAKHGLYRSLIANMVEGVYSGFKKELELVGVGYRASNQGQLLELTLGYSHPIFFAVPAEVKVETVSERGQNPKVVLESADKELIGEVAAKIRAFRSPEPYKGKGIRFVGEQVRRKAGKTAAK